VLASRFSEIEIFSTIRSSVLQDDTSVAVIDLGATGSKLYAVEKGIVLRSHSISSGAQDLTKRIAEGMHVSMGEAEELKRTYGLTGNGGELSQYMEPELDRMLREARLVITRYEEQSSGQVDEVILSGGGSVLMGIEERAAAALQKEVVRAQPFAKVGYPAFLEETLNEAGPSFAVALGVALRLLNES
jgi:type IV pilus assembly protein PilM